MGVKIIAYNVVVRDDPCPECGHGETWTVRDPLGVEGSTSYSDRADAEHEADIMNRAFQLGRDSIVNAVSKEDGKAKLPVRA